MEIVTMPVGVTLEGSAELSGWALRPVVPSVGAKKAASIVHYADMTEVVKTQVVDTAPVQMSLGLNAENGNWTLGAAWDLGIGSHDRLDNALILKARYAF